jgi:hypothetical protein
MSKFLLVLIVVLGMVMASFGQITKIYDIQYTEDPSGDSPLVDETVTIIGIVSAEHRGDVTANGGISGSYFFVMDSAVAWSGTVMIMLHRVIVLPLQVSLVNITIRPRLEVLLNLSSIVVRMKSRVPWKLRRLLQILQKHMKAV